MGRKIAVFDLDGTLVNTAPDLLDSLNYTLVGTGVPEVQETGFNTVVGHGARAMITKAFSAAQKDLPKDRLEALFKRFIDDYAGNIPGRSLPYPGVVAALNRLQEAGFFLAVCTNKTEAPSRALIGGLGLTSRFAAICGQDTFDVMKPHPRHLTETIALAGGDRDQAIMVGDSRTDVDTAKAAGIPVVAVDFGYSDRPVQEFDPSVIISHYDELTVALAEQLINAAQPLRAAGGQ